MARTPATDVGALTDYTQLNALYSGAGAGRPTKLQASKFTQNAVAFRNKTSNRRVGVFFEVTRAGMLGAQLICDREAPLPADTPGGRTSIFVVLPNDEISIQITDPAVEVQLHVIDPDAARLALT